MPHTYSGVEHKDGATVAIQHSYYCYIVGPAPGGADANGLQQSKVLSVGAPVVPAFDTLAILYLSLGSWVIIYIAYCLCAKVKDQYGKKGMLARRVALACILFQAIIMAALRLYDGYTTGDHSGLKTIREWHGPKTLGAAISMISIAGEIITDVLHHASGRRDGIVSQV